MKILVLGASGLVGGNCVDVFRKSGWDCIGTHFSFPTDDTVFYNTLDPNDKRNFDVKSFGPNAIVHCGALTHVDYCEDHQEESHQKTVQSTKSALELANSLDACFVYLSTDYVFDGAKGFYNEQDECNPISVYAEHKLEAELLVKAYSNFLVCRITNVYGDEIRGKNFVVRLAENMKQNQPMELRMPIDQYATPVNAHDVARAIRNLLADKKQGIYHLASTDYLNRVQLCERVFSYFGHAGVSLIPVTTKQLNQAAKRPLLGGFNASKFNNEYPSFGWTNVDDYLKKIASKSK